jgi:CRP-like cAMP-binding protein
MRTVSSDLLHGLAPADAEAILALGEPLQLSTGDTLFRLGAEADRLYLVLRGRIALSLPMQVYDDEREVLVEERQSGQAIGWSALVPPHRFTLSARAVVESEVLALPREPLLALFATRPDLGYAVMRSVAAVAGQRLQVFRAMWLREMQRVVKLTYA